jgi:putative membrane-bound dehydrogenase-like protein
LLHHVRVKFPVIVASAALACKVFGAELQVDEKDLPRVPATEPDKAISTFQLRDGFRIELVASEPLIVDPVAMSFDEDGRLFVVEMRDYSERRIERLGRVKLLEDTDGDGRFDKATIYATNLPWPTAVICYDGGVFVGASPDILYFKDSNGDGVADVRKVVFTGFGNGTQRLNVQQLFNSFTWGIDNRIHGALGGNPSIVTNLVQRGARPLELRGRDFSFDPRTFEMRAESGGGQWGMSFDDEGNKFICSNSRHIAVEMDDDRYSARNRFYSMPPPDVSVAVDGPAAEVFRISPDEPWRVLRTKWRVSGLVPGPVEGGGRASGYFTGAAGVTIYRGDAFPPEYRGDAFVADCGSNLIHRKKIRRDGLNFIAERASDEQRKEFLASRDNWFRPTTMANAPDGTLYVVDMYRETVEHPWSLPPELKSKLDLNSGNDRGRIYRVVPNGFKQPKPVQLSSANVAELVKTLDHTNGWHRDTASRLLFERRETNAVPLLRTLIKESPSNFSRMHGVSSLLSFRTLDLDDLKHALSDSDAAVRSHAVRGTDSYVRADPESDKDTWASLLRDQANDPDKRVRFQVALAADDSVTLTKIIARDVEQPWMRAAVLGGLSTGSADIFAALAGNGEFVTRAGALEFLREAARMAGASAPVNRVVLDARVASRSEHALPFVTALASGLERRGMSLSVVDGRTFEKLRADALRLIGESSLAETQRVEAVEFLQYANDTGSRAALVELLAPSSSPALQSAVVTVLSRRRDQTMTNVFARWSQLAPQTRAKAVSHALARRDMTSALLQAVENGDIARTELSASDIQRLTTYNDGAIRNQALKVFHRDDSTRTEIVKKFRGALELKGDAVRGHAIYQQRCITCHRSGAEGSAVGPDLASVANGGKEKLLTSILDPNAEVAAAFIAYSVETKGGESFLGVLAGENPLSVMLKISSGETTRIGRENISSMRGSDKSLMPEGLEEGLTAQDVADLLEFVTQAKPAP